MNAMCKREHAYRIPSVEQSVEHLQQASPGSEMSARAEERTARHRTEFLELELHLDGVRGRVLLRLARRVVRHHLASLRRAAAHLNQRTRFYQSGSIIENGVPVD